MRRLMVGLFMAAIVGMSAAGTFADDQEIARNIVEKLKVEQQQGKLKGFNIGVRVDNGDVWIEGQVAEPSQRTLVLETARRVRGVNQVVNGIQVGSEASVVQTAVQPAPVQEPQPQIKSLLASMGSAMRTTLAQQAATPAKLPEMSDSRPSATAAPSEKVETPSITAPAAALEAPAAVAERLVAQPQPTASAPLLATRPAPQPVATLPTPVAPPQTGVVAASNPQLAAALGYGLPAMPQAPQANRVIRGTPVAFAPARQVSVPTQQVSMPVQQVSMPARQVSMMQPINGGPVPTYMPGTGGGVAPAVYDHPNMPGYAWPSYASYPNYAGLTYPKQYSPTAWPYIGPFYPYPQVPLGWRKVVLEWDDGWWMLDFKSKNHY